MTNYYIEVTHSCGHTGRHTGGTTGGASGVRKVREFFAARKCDTCRPTCEYCRRVGDRENMLVTDDAHIFCNAWCRVQSLNPTHYREHNEIAVPGFLKDWEDHSYHNDACAHSVFYIGTNAAVSVWVERDNPEDRDTMATAKFCILWSPDYATSDNTEDLYTGDDAAVAARWAHAAEIVESGADADADMVGMVARIRELIAVEEGGTKAIEDDGPDVDEYDLRNE